ncbi:HlyD family efflux transporter periplasmic adaptor subunit [Microgenomates group bacterium]|nr:HlyD family efflux transporter periplasmic adaptor subunit [Microgenomates group bacterium]
MLKDLKQLLRRVPKAVWLLALPIVLLLALSLSPLDVPKSSTITVEGTIEINTLPYYTEIAGKVIEVPVNLGQRVAVGDTLVVLESPSAQNRLAELSTSALKMQLLIDELERGAPAADKKVATNEVEAARQLMFNAHADYLLSIDVVSDAENDEKVDHITREKLRLDRDNKKRFFEIAQLQFSSAEQGPLRLSASNNREQIASARADLEFLNQQLEQARADLAKTAIKATASGVVVINNADLGSLVVPGQILIEVSKEQEKTAVFWVPEEYLDRIDYGQTVRVTNKVINTTKEEATTHQGTINYIDLSAQYTPKEAANATNQNRLSFKVKVFLGDIPELRIAQKLLLTI